MVPNTNISRLKSANIRIATSPFCNFNCIYCDGPRSRSPGKPGAMEDFRRKPLNEGVISVDVLVSIVQTLHNAGFEGTTLTGGEPLVNPEWDVIVNKLAAIGMTRVEVTTNGMLLKSYIQRKGGMPGGLTLLKVSLDTPDPDRFKKLSRNGRLEVVMEGISAVKEKNPALKVRANKVLLRSDMNSLAQYIEFCEKYGINEITLLDLVLNNPEEKNFFQKEFISIPEVIQYLSAQMGSDFITDSRYGFQARLPSGLRIILKDSNATFRFSQCTGCPMYCQEGLYTVRVATDGTISVCPDRKALLPFIDGPQELEGGTLDKRAQELALLFLTARQMNTHDEFFKQNGISFVKENFSNEVRPTIK